MLCDFFARFVRKVHSDDYIRKALRENQGWSFLDIIGPNDIAYVIAIFKNGKDLWDQDIRIKAGGTPEKKVKPLFTSGGGQKRMTGKSLWNKVGMRYFDRWKIYGRTYMTVRRT